MGAAGIGSTNQTTPGASTTEWYTPKQIAGINKLAGIEPATDRGIQLKAATEGWQSSPRKARGGGLLYHISALPEATREAILMKAFFFPKSQIIDDTDDTDQAAIQAFLAARHITLSGAELADPIMRAKIACARAFESCPAYKGREALLASLGARYGKSSQQIRRWVSDIDSLNTRSTPHRITLSGERVEIPESSAFSPEALAFGISSYATNFHGGMKGAYRAMIEAGREKREALRLASPMADPWRIGDYTSFVRALKRIPQPVWLRIRKGDTGFELHGLPKIIRKWTALPVQTVLCGDQKIFDYLTYNPETDEIITPEGYFWMDCSSRMIVGAWIELGHYNQFTVGNSLREALRYGIPAEIYTDWGKPEGAKHIQHILKTLSGHAVTGDFAAMEERYAAFDGEECDGVSACRRDGEKGSYPDTPSPRHPDTTSTSHRRAQPGKPWMKPIENVMNIIEKILLDMQLPGYRKRDASDPWRNKEQQDLLRRQAKTGRLVHTADFITAVFQAIDTHNRREKQLKEGGSLVPLDFFTQGLRQRPVMVYADETLDYICLPCFERTPHQAVVSVTIRQDDHRSYYSSVLSGRRKRVRITVDPYDREAPAHLHDAATLKPLGAAEPWHAQDPRDREGLSRKIASQKELMKWTREQAERVRNGFGVIDGLIPKLAPVTAAARRADEDTKVYHLRKTEEAAEIKAIAETAKIEQKALEREIAASAGVIHTVDGWSLPEGRDRYIYWLAVQTRVTLDEPLTEPEQHFYTRYPNTADYRACCRLHEEYKEIYLGG